MDLTSTSSPPFTGRYEFTIDCPCEAPPAISDTVIASLPILHTVSPHSRTESSMTSYRFFALHEEFIPGCVHVIADAFANTPTDGLLHHSGYSYEAKAGSLRLLLPEKLRQHQDLSIVALDDSNHVVGAFLNELGARVFRQTPPSLEIRRFNDRFECIGIVLEVLKDSKRRYCEWAENAAGVDPQKTIHVYDWGVLREHRGNRLAQTALELTLRRGLDDGFEALFVKCTNVFSQQVAERTFVKIDDENERLVVRGIPADDVRYADFAHLHPGLAHSNANAVRWLKQEGLWKPGRLDENHVADVCRTYHFDFRRDWLLMEEATRPSTPWQIAAATKVE